MAYPLYLTVRPVPPTEEIPALREFLEKAFPDRENLPYLDGLSGSPDHPALPRITAQRLGALSLLPSLLAEAKIPTDSLLLRRDESGRPFCVSKDGSPVGFDFNLSHSAGHIACAVLVGNGRVGLDIEEPIPPPRALPLIRRFCTEGELTLLAELPPDDALAASFFTSTWVEREAIAKQEGGGMPLRFDTTRLPDGVMLWTGYLPTTDTMIALCAPMKNAPKHPRVLSDSLPVSFQ